MGQASRKSSLARAAFEEGIRFESPVQTFFRTTTKPVSLGGVQMDEGSKYLCCLLRQTAILENGKTLIVTISSDAPAAMLVSDQHSHLCRTAARTTRRVRSCFPRLRAR